ncbi:hypothetical protein FE257_005659, partial [Aspergillus nanangensis]
MRTDDSLDREEALPLNATFESTYDDKDSQDSPQKSTWPVRWGLYGICFVFLTVCFAFLVASSVFFREPSDDAGYQRLYSPLWDVVSYQPTVFDADIHGPSPFRGKVRPELDEAWDTTTNTSLILIDEQEMKALGESTHQAAKVGTKYFAVVEVFHQLHCVDLIRKYIHRDDYRDYMAFQDDEETILAHVDHCVDLLRQVIQCAGDVGLVVFDQKGPGKPPQPRFSNRHMCRDFNAIQT